MNKISCEVIKDIMPIYVDNICSQESRSVIEEHILECEECSLKLQQMQENLNIYSHGITDEKISQKKLFSKVKKKWIVSIILTVIFLFSIFLLFHIATLFQEGNPINYSSAFIQLIGKDYVEVTNKKDNTNTSQKREFITKKDDSQKLYEYIENEYNVKFEMKMASACLFLNKEENSYIWLEERTYMKYYTLWEVGELVYK